MPNPIVWLNDTLQVGGAAVAARSNLAASPDGRYSLVFVQDGNLLAGAVFNANGTGLADPLTNPSVYQELSGAVAFLADGRLAETYALNLGTGFSTVNFRLNNGANQNYSPLTNEINAGSGNGSVLPIITGLTNGNFAISWYDGIDSRQKVRVFDITGTPVSGIVTVDPIQTIGDGPNAPANIIALDGGGFAIGYQSFGQFSYLSIFTASGDALATDIDAFTSSNDIGVPSLAQLADGRIVVASGFYSGAGLLLHFFSQSGGSLSSDISVALPGVDASEDFNPRIAALNDGRFMVVTSANQEGAVDSDIWGVIIKADGTIDGTPFRVNDTTGPGTGSQSAPSIIVLADGRVVVSWTDNNTGNGDIVQKIYDPRETSLNGPASGMADDWYGTGFADNVSMALGNDVFHAAAGNDYVYGDGGNDSLYGGDGADYVKGGNGNDYIYGDDGLGALTDIGDLWLAGELGDDTIVGGAGDDRIDGGEGNDTLYGVTDRDYITGGNGVDYIYGGDEAGAGDRWLGGEGGNDNVYGGEGDDRLDGGDGVDFLGGGNGNDYITGGNGVDYIYGGDETVGGDAYLAGDAGIDTIYGGIGNDRIDGGTEGDLLYGGNGQDTITGADGDDYILGGAATDGLYGGAGIDIFDYDVGSGTDNIYDFTNDVDKIRIDPAFGFNVPLVLTAASIFGNHVYINLNGGDGIIILNWISTGHTIAELANDIVIA
jgi:Ca2+-binding RTX toxin-like protein